MNITAELLDKDIAETKKQMVQFQQTMDQAKALLAQTSGALLVLKNMRAFLDLPEPTIAEKPAIPIQDIAEAVAGPGAVVEAIDPIPAEVAAVVNAYGKYEEPKNG